MQKRFGLREKSAAKYFLFTRAQSIYSISYENSLPLYSSRGGGFGTRMFTADADDGNLRIITPYNYTSHFIWTPDGKKVIVDSAHSRKRQLYMLDISDIAK